MPSELVSTSLFGENTRSTMEWRLHWLFRVAVFCEFLGHGAFGILTKKAWVSYFAVFGIPEAWAYRLMPIVGSVDILMATLTLAAPIRAALLYMTFWGLFTSLLRPLAGEGWWEFLERAYGAGWELLKRGGSYAAPLLWIVLDSFKRKCTKK